MGLKDTLNVAPGYRRGIKPDHVYLLDQVLDALDADDRVALMRALVDTDGWPTARIEQALLDEGVDVSQPTIRTYRRRRLWEQRADWPNLAKQVAR